MNINDIWGLCVATEAELGVSEAILLSHPSPEAGESFHTYSMLRNCYNGMAAALQAMGRENDQDGINQVIRRQYDQLKMLSEQFPVNPVQVRHDPDGAQQSAQKFQQLYARVFKKFCKDMGLGENP